MSENVGLVKRQNKLERGRYYPVDNKHEEHG